MSVFQTCPHCGARSTGGDFCESCGKAVGGVQAGPRIVDGGQVAMTSVGMKLQTEQLEKKAKSAATALLVVAIFSVIGLIGLFAFFKIADNDPRQQVDWSVATPVLIVQAVICVIFFGLWIWARKSPLPAAIVGLVVYGSIIALAAFNDPMTLAQGAIFKIIIIVVLIKAIGSGVQHRQLLSQQASPSRF